MAETTTPRPRGTRLHSAAHAELDGIFTYMEPPATTRPMPQQARIINEAPTVGLPNVSHRDNNVSARTRA